MLDINKIPPQYFVFVYHFPYKLNNNEDVNKKS